MIHYDFLKLSYAFIKEFIAASMQDQTSLQNLMIFKIYKKSLCSGKLGLNYF